MGAEHAKCKLAIGISGVLCRLLKIKITTEFIGPRRGRRNSVRAIRSRRAQGRRKGDRQQKTRGSFYVTNIMSSVVVIVSFCPQAWIQNQSAQRSSPAVTCGWCLHVPIFGVCRAVCQRYRSASRCFDATTIPNGGPKNGTPNGGPTNDKPNGGPRNDKLNGGPK